MGGSWGNWGDLGELGDLGINAFPVFVELGFVGRFWHGAREPTSPGLSSLKLRSLFQSAWTTVSFSQAHTGTFLGQPCAVRSVLWVQCRVKC